LIGSVAVADKFCCKGTTFLLNPAYTDSCFLYQNHGIVPISVRVEYVARSSGEMSIHDADALLHREGKRDTTRCVCLRIACAKKSGLAGGLIRKFS